MEWKDLFYALCYVAIAMGTVSVLAAGCVIWLFTPNFITYLIFVLGGVSFVAGWFFFVRFI